MVMWKHDPAKAAAYFLDALTYSPQDPLLLQELGRSQCQEMNWYSGSQTLQQALAAGAGPDARLMRAESLLWVGTPGASEELDLYLNGRSLKSMPLRVRTLEEHIQDREKGQGDFPGGGGQGPGDGRNAAGLSPPPAQNLPDFEPMPLIRHRRRPSWPPWARTWRSFSPTFPISAPLRRFSG